MSFGPDNLPYGVFSVGGGRPRVGVRLEDQVLDLAPLLHDDVFLEPTLNPFMARGRGAWRATRARVQDLLADGRGAEHLIPLDRVSLHLPIDVADYVDFYASLEHASHLGRMFRPDEEPLKPNWRHLPVGYHGRAGTVVVSGTEIRRPNGQRPVFGPSQKLDIEAEVGYVVGVGGSGPFEEHVFGVVLVNDWSARDIQAWEYVPLGPFLGKSFATTMSAWVTPLDALDHARVPGRAQDPAPLDYLRRKSDWGLDLGLRIELNGEIISSPDYRDMYWTPDQMLAHITVNGAHLRTGDLYASGTVSGADDPGSLIELTWNGTRPLKSGQSFLEDGDTVTITATTPSGLSLGEVTGRILPATLR
ncbi:fumarylacetoacetate hydrolase family protein [Herbidospora sp. RD11066]